MKNANGKCGGRRGCRAYDLPNDGGVFGVFRDLHGRGNDIQTVLLAFGEEVDGKSEKTQAVEARDS